MTRRYHVTGARPDGATFAIVALTPAAARETVRRLLELGCTYVSRRCVS